MSTGNRTVSVGNRVKCYRTARGLNQDDLAALTGISQPTISRLERGDGTVDGSTALQLATALSVGVDSLLGPMLMEDKVVTAGRPGDHTSTMTSMRWAARSYLADYRRATA